MPVTKRFVVRILISIILILMSAGGSILIKETVDSVIAPENSLPIINGSIRNTTPYIERAGYESNLFTREVKVPTVSPPDLRLIITNVTADTPILINFSKEPESLSISMSEGQYNLEFTEQDLEALYTPTVAGVYTYCIEAAFDRGSIIYYFAIEVKDMV